MMACEERQITGICLLRLLSLPSFYFLLTLKKLFWKLNQRVTHIEIITEMASMSCILPGFSTLIISAPRSPRSIVANGPARTLYGQKSYCINIIFK